MTEITVKIFDSLYTHTIEERDETIFRLQALVRYAKSKNFSELRELAEEENAFTSELNEKEMKELKFNQVLRCLKFQKIDKKEHMEELERKKEYIDLDNIADSDVNEIPNMEEYVDGCIYNDEDDAFIVASDVNKKEIVDRRIYNDKGNAPKSNSTGIYFSKNKEKSY